MFGETTTFYVVIWNHPVETTIKKTWLFGVPGAYVKIKLTPRCFFFDAMRSIKAPVKSICRSRTWSLGIFENSQPFPPPEIQPPRPRCEEFWPLKNRHRNPDGFFWQEIHTKWWMFWKCHLRKNQRITLDWQDAKTAVYFEKISWPGTWSFPTQILLRWKNLNPWTWHFYRENCPFTRVRQLFFMWVGLAVFGSNVRQEIWCCLISIPKISNPPWKLGTKNWSLGRRFSIQIWCFGDFQVPRSFFGSNS